MHSLRPTSLMLSALLVASEQLVNVCQYLLVRTTKLQQNSRLRGELDKVTH